MDGKIFKISGYLVDPDGEYCGDDVEEELKNIGLIARHLNVELEDVPNWDDENPLNYNNCDLAECEKYFQEDTRPGEWILCSERLPCGSAICCGEDGVMIIGFIEKGNSGYYAYDDDGTPVNNVVAWMPVPAPYERGGSSE
jgi:hypothetical protein|uniref:DUF551 domain-containing protein n=1 Tax=Siphoviridae sp. ctVOP12 TaxID=2825531 RepID=A0A8S5VAD1_9CAUD|nr:MAG TPA: Protein of unknown function (DUF551) [Siphoviridae sp. ctVOP12]